YQLALKNLPDLVICSYEMFESYENDMLHKLRDDSVFTSTPFIFLDEKKLGRKEKKGLNLGFDYFIMKPFSSSELQKIAKLALEKSDAVAQKSEKKLSELRGSLSFALPHEFFTPLNGILGFTDILINDLGSLSKNEVRQMLQYIHKDALRLNKLTENFLAFAQLEVISKDPEKIAALTNTYYLNAKEIVKSTAVSMARDAGREDDLILELEDGAVRISEGYLNKVMAELISNAFKFSEKDTPVIVSLYSNDTSVMLTIADSGRGMTPKQIASVGAYMQFDRMQQEQQGSGLGLIIAKKITELHGGEFKIESTPGEGTKVHLIFDN